MRSTKGFFHYGAVGIAADAVDAIQTPGPLLISLPHQNDLAVPGPEPIAILPGPVHIQLKLGVLLPFISRRRLILQRGFGCVSAHAFQPLPAGKAIILLVAQADDLPVRRPQLKADPFFVSLHHILAHGPSSFWIGSKKGKRLHASPEWFYKVSCPVR